MRRRDGWVALGLLSFAACGGATPEPTSANRTATADPVETALPSSSDTHPLSPNVAKGVAALEANDAAEAKAYFQAALKADPKDADAHYYLGALSEKAGDVQAAEASYKAALAARPGFALAAGNLCALYDDALRYDDALALAASVLGDHPRDGTLHLSAAIAHAGKKDKAAATRDFDAAIGINPRDASYRLVYGHWLGVLQDPDTAATELRTGVDLATASKDLGVLAALGHELHVVGAWSDCISAFTAAIGIKDAAELITERAACKVGQKDDPGALEDLRAATAKDPSYAPAQYYLGNELAKSGDYSHAVAAYQAFLKLEPKGPLAKGVEEKIRLAKQHGGH
jgi:tetratricopeptide (TPR) repeat protein